MPSGIKKKKIQLKKPSGILLRNCLSNASKNQSFFKDTHRKKVLSNKTPTLTESINMEIWVV